VKELLLVTAREIKVRGRTKSYHLGIAVSCLLVAALVLLPGFFDGSKTYQLGVLGPALDAGIQVESIHFDDRAAAEGALRSGDVDALLVDGTTIVTSDTLDPQLGVLLQQAHQAAQLKAAGVTLTPLGVQSITGTHPAQAWLAMLLMVALFLLIMYTSIYVAVGVVEEKSGRIVEILLSSLQPWQLLNGKIVGLTVLAMINLVAVGATGLGAMLLAGDSASLPSGFDGVIANSMLWFLPGCVFFAALAAMLGSLVSRQEDLNSVLTPLMLLLVAICLLSLFVASSPHSTVSQIFSMIPPFSTMVMPVRFAVGAVPLWQLGAAWVLMLVATTGVALLAARVYRRAVLHSGARLKLSQLWNTSQP